MISQVMYRTELTPALWGWASAYRHMSKVFVGAGGVGYDVEVVARRPRDDEIVDDSAVVVAEERQRAVVVGQCGHVANDEAVDELDPVSPGHQRLQHVRDVEQRHVLPADQHPTNCRPARRHGMRSRMHAYIPSSTHSYFSISLKYCLLLHLKIETIYHADGSVFTAVCFFQMISQKPMQLGTTNLTQKCFNVSPGNHLF